jgi:hypothetical protein
MPRVVRLDLLNRPIVGARVTPPPRLSFVMQRHSLAYIIRSALRLDVNQTSRIPALTSLAAIKSTSVA